MIEVFLGGTCNDSNWRDSLISLLEVQFFNPVVDEWTVQAQEIEKQKRESCDLVLYVITPKMTGVYSIAEATYDACTRPEKTLFMVRDYDSDKTTEYLFNDHQMKSMNATSELIASTGAKTFNNFIELAEYINTYERKLD